MSELMLDAAGRRRSLATLPEFHSGLPPRNKGMRYPADPPTIEEIVTVMQRAGDGVHGLRLRGLIVVLWRAGLRICEALGPEASRLRSTWRCSSGSQSGPRCSSSCSASRWSSRCYGSIRASAQRGSSRCSHHRRAADVTLDTDSRSS